MPAAEIWAMPFVEYDEVGAACAECGSLFRSEEALREHKRAVHSAKPQASSSPKTRGTGRIVCEVCRARFHSVDALARHNRAAHVQ